MNFEQQRMFAETLAGNANAPIMLAGAEVARRGRGRPKTVITHDFACPNPECNFYNQPAD